jgi:hypothetical protein
MSTLGNKLKTKVLVPEVIESSLTPNQKFVAGYRKFMMDREEKHEAAQSVFGSPKEERQLKTTKTLVLGTVEQNYGIYQIPSFRDLVTTLWGDPLLVESCMMFAQQVIATGFFLTGSPEYNNDAHRINGKTALDIIKKWCDVNNIDIKVFEIALEKRAFGNSFWRLDSKMGFVKIPVEAVWHMVRENPDVPLQEDYQIQLVPIYGGVVLGHREYIHFRSFITGYKAPLGMGLLQPLLTKPVDSKGVVAPSVYDMRLSRRTNLDEGFRKFSFPNVWIGLPELSNEDFEAQGIATKSANMKATGNRIVTNSTVTVQVETPNRTTTYEPFIKAMDNEFFMGLADPSLKLGLEQGFTKATSVTAAEVYQFKISSERRGIKQQFEDLFKQVLVKEGFDGEKAVIEMNFGPEETAQYNIADIFAATDREILSLKSAQSLLKKYHKWDINEDDIAKEIAKQHQEQISMAMAQGGTMKGQKAGSGGTSATKPMVLTPPLKATETPEKLSQETADVGTESTTSLLDIPQMPIGAKVEVTELSQGLAGISLDGSTIYIDRYAIEAGFPLDVLKQREIYEYPLLSKLGMESSKAHILSAIHEKAYAIKSGYDWSNLENLYTVLIPKIKARGSSGPVGIFGGN